MYKEVRQERKVNYEFQLIMTEVKVTKIMFVILHYSTPWRPTADPPTRAVARLITRVREKLMVVSGIEPELGSHLLREDYKASCATIHHTTLFLRRRYISSFFFRRLKDYI